MLARIFSLNFFPIRYFGPKYRKPPQHKLRSGNIPENITPNSTNKNKKTTDLKKRLHESRSSLMPKKKVDVKATLHPDLLKMPNVGILGKKKIKPESPTSEISVIPQNQLVNLENVKENKNEEKSEDLTKMLIPLSPKIGPFELDAKRTTKSYYYCTCGLSVKQPLCDGMHFGTKFKPLKFQLAERQMKMFLCGCKMTETAPFCDGRTCVQMQKELDQKNDEIKKIKSQTQSK